MSRTLDSQGRLIGAPPPGMVYSRSPQSATTPGAVSPAVKANQSTYSPNAFRSNPGSPYWGKGTQSNARPAAPVPQNNTGFELSGGRSTPSAPVPYQQPSYNSPNNTQNYANQAMGSVMYGGLNMTGGGTNLYGNYGGAVVGGGPIVMGGGGGPMNYDAWRTKFKSQRGYGVDAASQSDYGEYQNYVQQAGQGSQTLGDRLLADTQRAAQEGRAANEQRYDAILNGDPTGVISFEAWAKSRGFNTKPNASTTALYQKETAGQQAAAGGYRDRYERGMANLEGMGVQAGKDINASYDKMGADQSQNLASRGLGNSTITATVDRANQSARQDSLGRLQEQVRQQRLDTDSKLSGDTLGFMERRQDTYPDTSSIADLMMRLGAGGYLSPGSGGGGGGNQIGVGTNINGVPMTYGGQGVASSYGWGKTNGLNQASANGWGRTY